MPSGPGRQPVSSNTSRAAVTPASSPASAIPPGSSQPHSSVTNRYRHNISTRSRSSTTAAIATVFSRTTWCSNRCPSGVSMSTSVTRTQKLSYTARSPKTFVLSSSDRPGAASVMTVEASGAMRRAPGASLIN